MGVSIKVKKYVHQQDSEHFLTMMGRCGRTTHYDLQRLT